MHAADFDDRFGIEDRGSGDEVIADRREGIEVAATVHFIGIGYGFESQVVRGSCYRIGVGERGTLGAGEFFDQSKVENLALRSSTGESQEPEIASRPANEPKQYPARLDRGGLESDSKARRDHGADSAAAIDPRGHLGRGAPGLSRPVDDREDEARGEQDTAGYKRDVGRERALIRAAIEGENSIAVVRAGTAVGVGADTIFLFEGAPLVSLRARADDQRRPDRGDRGAESGEHPRLPRRPAPIGLDLEQNRRDALEFTGGNIERLAEGLETIAPGNELVLAGRHPMFGDARSSEHLDAIDRNDHVGLSAFNNDDGSVCLDRSPDSIKNRAVAARECISVFASVLDVGTGIDVSTELDQASRGVDANARVIPELEGALVKSQCLDMAVGFELRVAAGKQRPRLRPFLARDTGGPRLGR